MLSGTIDWEAVTRTQPVLVLATDLQPRIRVKCENQPDQEQRLYCQNYDGLQRQGKFACHVIKPVGDCKKMALYCSAQPRTFAY